MKGMKGGKSNPLHTGKTNNADHNSHTHSSPKGSMIGGQIKGGRVSGKSGTKGY